MPKYDPDTSHWDETDDTPPRWREETSADIEIEVTLHQEGYQESQRWRVHIADHTTDADDPRDIVALYAVEDRNKGNYWRQGNIRNHGIDFVDLPMRVRRRVAAVLNRDVEELTPDERTVHREDGHGLGDVEENS